MHRTRSGASIPFVRRCGLTRCEPRGCAPSLLLRPALLLRERSRPPTSVDVTTPFDRATLVVRARHSSRRGAVRRRRMRRYADRALSDARSPACVAAVRVARREGARGCGGGRSGRSKRPAPQATGSQRVSPRRPPEYLRASDPHAILNERRLRARESAKSPLRARSFKRSASIRPRERKIVHSNGLRCPEQTISHSTRSETSRKPGRNAHVGGTAPRNPPASVSTVCLRAPS